MPEVRISIGGRDFDVACQEGEEHFLHAAANLLDAEASSLLSQIGRMPEPRMLLMAGLMLADKTAGLDDQLKKLEEKVAAQQAWIEAAQTGSDAPPPAAPAPEPGPDLGPVLERVAERLEGLAATAEAKAQA